MRSKETKHGDQAIILLNWLFKDEVLFQAVASRLANVISRKDDRYLNLGWCTLVRRLLEYEADTDQQSLDGTIADFYEFGLSLSLCFWKCDVGWLVTRFPSMAGIRQKCDSLVKILCPCIPHLSSIICKGRYTCFLAKLIIYTCVIA